MFSVLQPSGVVAALQRCRSAHATNTLPDSVLPPARGMMFITGPPDSTSPMLPDDGEGHFLRVARVGQVVGAAGLGHGDADAVHEQAAIGVGALPDSDSIVPCALKCTSCTGRSRRPAGRRARRAPARAARCSSPAVGMELMTSLVSTVWRCALCRSTIGDSPVTVIVSATSPP